ncbi:MAG: glycosyltransferase [Candidatus Pacebacteria bacterium]|nr:glycosyltransferase [Candidatus Paceibacterota bacterium]MCF7862615.1 glycosyltransferase [Candidatus Paceibacterota bacterium]
MGIEKIKVSIILPTYNGAERIQKSIESVTEQSFKDWELLVIDDGSTDNTKEVVEDLKSKDSRIIYIKNEQNLGIQKTLNKGLGLAKGEYIARIDDDDLWIDKDKLQKQVEFLDSNPDYVLVGTGVVAVDESGNSVEYIPPTTNKEIKKRIIGMNCFLHSSVFFRKETVVRLGGYSEDITARHVEDYDLWLRLGLEGKLANIPFCSVFLVSRGNSISSSNRNIQAWRTFKISLRYCNLYSDKLKQVFISIVKTSFIIMYPFLPVSRPLLNKIKAFFKKEKKHFIK